MSNYRTREISGRDAESREERLENATKQLMQLAQQILKPTQSPNTISPPSPLRIPQPTLKPLPPLNNSFKLKHQSRTISQALKVDQVAFLETNEELDEVFNVNVIKIDLGNLRKFYGDDSTLAQKMTYENMKKSNLFYDVMGGRQQLAPMMTSQKLLDEDSMKDLYSMKESKHKKSTVKKSNSTSESSEEKDLRTKGKPKIMKLKKKRKKTKKLAIVKKGDYLVSNRRKSEKPGSAPIVKQSVMPFASGFTKTSTPMPSMPMMIPAHLMQYPSMPMHISFNVSPMHISHPQTPLLSGFETPLEAPLQFFPKLDPQPRSLLSPGVISIDRATVGKLHPHLVKTDNWGHCQIMGDSQVIPGKKKKKGKSTDSFSTNKR